MDMTTVARPYARAAFEVAKGSESIADWQTALKIDREMVVSAELAQWLKNPERSSEEKLKVFELVHSGFCEHHSATIKQQHQNFLKMLLANDRLFALADIYKEYKKLAAKNASIVNVRVDSALELGDAERNQLEKSLRDRFKCDVKTHYMVKPDLVGGMLIKTSGWVLDGSIESLLTRLKDNLIIER